MLEQQINFLSWNVRGLNCPDRRAAVHATIASSSCHVVCLQETKLNNVDQFTAAFLGGHRLRSFAQRPATGTRGGILLLWDDLLVEASNVTNTSYCLSAMIRVRATDVVFKFTSVYGPTDPSCKDMFFAELLSQKPPLGVAWLASGDFNQIYRARDKNKRNVHHGRINRFRATLHSCELKEIHLQNRRFTWSNERENPTLCKLDSFFCNAEWDTTFNTHILHALSSSLSDHCPLLLADDKGPRRPRTFKFENFWASMPGFNEVVQMAWNERVDHTDPYQIIFHKLKKTAIRLSEWSRGLFSKAKIHLQAALLVILRLDIAQEDRPLSPEERDLRARLKRRVIALAVIERSRKKQCARISNLKEGDANTKFFHRRVNARRRKNHIHRIKNEHGWVTEHEAKENLIQDHFSHVMKKGAKSSKDFNWEELNMERLDMHGLDSPMTEMEVLQAINDMPNDKAPGPDGFTGLFFKKCWGTVKHDLMRAIARFDSLHTSNLHWLNSANVVLLPKKDGAEGIADYRPISLIHAIAKIIAKVLSTRLTPHMTDLISNAQSAFIKTRSIHDNFMYVRNLARRLHKSKTPSLLFKLDIRKAFDSVKWEYILGLLQRRGFPSKFRDWITALLSSSSSRIILNGIAGNPIKHGRGFRQGDPISPLLFVIAIDPLQRILDVATRKGLLHKIRGRGSMMRTSLYADDAAIFLAPIKKDVDNLANILRGFGEVTGLCTNFHKSSMVPIRCNNLDLDHITQNLPATRASFPLRYLGLPLSVWKLRLVDLQFLVDKVASKLTTYEGQNITTIGRTALVKSVLTSQVIYFITPLIIPPSILLKVNQLERAFLWSGSDKTTGAKCKVNWEIVCRPLEYGGLGVLNMEKFARALRLRWPWYEWKEPTKLWVGMGNPCNEEDLNFFYASTTITVGNGAKTPFWESPWLLGRKPKNIAPLIFEVSSRKKWKVREAIKHNAWMLKIKPPTVISVEFITQFFTLWMLLDEVHLDALAEDDILWKHTTSGHYSAASAYKAQFIGMVFSPMDQMVWKVWGPPKVKFFAWLALQDRIWTADRLAKRGWPNCGLCPLCKRVQESGSHLFFKCRYTLRLWALVIEKFHIFELDTSSWHLLDSVNAWWTSTCDAGTPNRQAKASLTMLVSWTIWNERNARVFRFKSAPPTILLNTITTEANLWVTARAKKLGSFISRE